MLRTTFGLGKRGDADQRRPPGHAKTKRANRWVPQLEALEDRYVPSLIGSPVYSPGQVTFNFDNQANDVYVSASFGPLNTGTTTVDWWTGFEWHSYDVYFNPMFSGGDPTIVLNMGTTPDSIKIQGNANPILVIGRSLHEAVKIGSYYTSWPPGNVQDIQNTVTVTNASWTDLTIDDSGNPAAKTATLTSGSLTGLAPAAINFHSFDLASLIIRGGTGNDTFTVADTPASGWGGFTTNLLCGLGDDTINLQMTTGPLEIDGGNGTNSLFGPNADTTWQITGFGAGFLTSSAFGSYPSFSSIQSFTGGSAADRFMFFNGGFVTGSINGGGGSNTLDYSGVIDNVLVDLQTGVADRVFGGVSGIQNLIGANGGLPDSFNLLIGAGGGTLTGGIGRRNILVAGGSAATLHGGDREDLLIAGSTAYDADPALVSWFQIANYWASGGDDFVTRSSKLMQGNGVPALSAGTVIGNGGGNTLSGLNELALIYSDGLDALNLSTFDPGLLLFPISP